MTVKELARVVVDGIQIRVKGRFVSGGDWYEVQIPRWYAGNKRPCYDILFFEYEPTAPARIDPRPRSVGDLRRWGVDG